MATKSAIMTSYRALCSRRIWEVNDAIEEHTGETLFPEQVKYLKSICDKLMDQKKEESGFWDVNNAIKEHT